MPSVYPVQGTEKDRFASVKITLTKNNNKPYKNISPTNRIFTITSCICISYVFVYRNDRQELKERISFYIY